MVKQMEVTIRRTSAMVSGSNFDVGDIRSGSRVPNGQWIITVASFSRFSPWFLHMVNIGRRNLADEYRIYIVFQSTDEVTSVSVSCMYLMLCGYGANTDM